MAITPNPLKENEDQYNIKPNLKTGEAGVSLDPVLEQAQQPVAQQPVVQQQPMQTKTPVDFSKINVGQFKEWKKTKEAMGTIRYYAGSNERYNEIMNLNVPASEKIAIAKKTMSPLMKSMDQDYFGETITSKEFINKYYDKLGSMNKNERNLYSAHLSNLKNKERSEAIAKTKGSNQRAKFFRQYKKNEGYVAAATDIYSTISGDARALGGDIEGLLKVFKTDLGASQNEDGTWSTVDYENVARKSISDIRTELWKVAQNLTIPAGTGYTNPVTGNWVLYPTPTAKNPDIDKRTWFNNAMSDIKRARNTMRKVYDYEEFQEFEQQRPEDDPLNIFSPSQVELNY
tara:strand:+ start:2267 stop:3298 length:1032 start_codon:yes stop_codon:yes gene_type:complete